jgi:hypothetical protein
MIDTSSVSSIPSKSGGPSESIFADLDKLRLAQRHFATIRTPRYTFKVLLMTVVLRENRQPAHQTVLISFRKPS